MVLTAGAFTAMQLARGNVYKHIDRARPCWKVHNIQFDPGTRNRGCKHGRGLGYPCSSAPFPLFEGPRFPRTLPS